MSRLSEFRFILYEIRMENRFQNIIEAENLGRYYAKLQLRREQFIKYFTEAKDRADRKAEDEAKWQANREHEQIMGTAVTDSGEACGCGASNCQVCKEEWLTGGMI